MVRLAERGAFQRREVRLRPGLGAGRILARGSCPADWCSSGGSALRDRTRPMANCSAASSTRFCRRSSSRSRPGRRRLRDLSQLRRPDDARGRPHRSDGFARRPMRRQRQPLLARHSGHGPRRRCWDRRQRQFALGTITVGCFTPPGTAAWINWRFVRQVINGPDDRAHQRRSTALSTRLESFIASSIRRPTWSAFDSRRWTRRGHDMDRDGARGSARHRTDRANSGSTGRRGTRWPRRLCSRAGSRSTAWAPTRASRSRRRARGAYYSGRGHQRGTTTSSPATDPRPGGSPSSAGRVRARADLIEFDVLPGSTPLAGRISSRARPTRMCSTWTGRTRAGAPATIR
jgi:hypothetical protein